MNSEVINTFNPHTMMGWSPLQCKRQIKPTGELKLKQNIRPSTRSAFGTYELSGEELSNQHSQNHMLHAGYPFMAANSASALNFNEPESKISIEVPIQNVDSNDVSYEPEVKQIFTGSFDKFDICNNSPVMEIEHQTNTYALTSAPTEINNLDMEIESLEVNQLYNEISSPYLPQNREVQAPQQNYAHNQVTPAIPHLPINVTPGAIQVFQSNALEGYVNDTHQRHPVLYQKSKDFQMDKEMLMLNEIGVEGFSNLHNMETPHSDNIYLQARQGQEDIWNVARFGKPDTQINH
jgi:hypothetical protein